MFTNLCFPGPRKKGRPSPGALFLQKELLLEVHANA
jgi:hypothetical protein